MPGNQQRESCWRKHRPPLLPLPLQAPLLSSLTPSLALPLSPLTPAPCNCPPCTGDNWPLDNWPLYTGDNCPLCMGDNFPLCMGDNCPLCMGGKLLHQTLTLHRTLNLSVLKMVITPLNLASMKVCRAIYHIVLYSYNQGVL